MLDLRALETLSTRNVLPSRPWIFYTIPRIPIGFPPYGAFPARRVKRTSYKRSMFANGTC